MSGTPMSHDDLARLIHRKLVRENRSLDLAEVSSELLRAFEGSPDLPDVTVIAPRILKTIKGLPSLVNYKAKGGE